MSENQREAFKRGQLEFRVQQKLKYVSNNYADKCSLSDKFNYKQNLQILSLPQDLCKLNLDIALGNCPSFEDEGGEDRG